MSNSSTPSCYCGNNNLDDYTEPMKCACGALFCFDCGGDDKCDKCLEKEEEEWEEEKEKEKQKGDDKKEEKK